MKMNKILLILLLLSFVQLNSQDSINLKYLIDKTLEENYQIKIIRNQQEISDNMNTIGNAGMLPNVNLNSSANMDISSSESNYFNGTNRVGNNAQSNNFQAMAEVSYSIFDGFRMFAEKDKLELLAQISTVETKYYIEQTVSDLSNTYYSLLKEIEILRLYEKSLEISKYRIEVEKQKLELGSGNKLLYNQAVIDFNSDSLILLNQKMIIENLKVQINKLINEDLNSELILENSDIELQGIENADAIIQRAINNNYELEISKIQQMISEANHRIAKSNLYPQIDLYGNYSLSQQRSQVGFIESANSHGLNLGVRVRLNLYDGGKQRTQIKNSEIEIENSNLNSKDTEQIIKSEIIQLQTTYNSYLKQYIILQESYEAGKKSIEIANQQLKSGAINGFEFRQNQISVIRIQNQLINLNYNLRMIELDIYRMSGNLLDKLISL